MKTKRGTRNATIAAGERPNRGYPVVLVAFVLVDHAFQGLAGQEAAQVGAEEVYHPILAQRGAARDVGRDHHVGQAPQQMVGREGLRVRYVKSGAADLAGLQRFQ